MWKIKIIRVVVLTSALLCAAAGNVEAQSTQNQATIVITAEEPAKTYDPMIFGGFIEHLGKQIYGGFFDPGSALADEMGFRLDVIEAVKELKVPVIRWPGGCFVDSYHWQKGIGPQRQPYDDDRWGVLEPNTFGTHEFIELCRRVDAEPYICQNSLASIQEMADWVAYCNGTTGELAELRKKNGHPEPFNVKFWSVGNEKGGKGYIDKVRDTAAAMKEVDPSIQVTCSGSHGPRAYIDPYLFQTAGKYLDLLSVHEYWVPNFQVHQTPDYLSCMMLSEKPDTHISAVVKSINAAGMRGRIKIAFDEWNLRSWHHPGFSGHQPRKVDYQDPAIRALIQARDKSLDPSLYTMADALFCASFFNACLRNAEYATMANIACLVNQTGPLHVHPKGIVKRTHFHTMAMYANLLQANVVQTHVNSDRFTQGKSSFALVDAIATVDESGNKWAVAMMNRHPSKKVNCTLKMAESLVDGSYRATVLTGQSPDAYNAIGHPNRVTPKKMMLTFKNGITSLPPHSLVIVGGRLTP
ncbi:MAG: alpha-L-arabinofuranosidase C-terminal domain-containing protein [Planctomycetota bacterium]|nr:alpha-L-arabinofuranosidase C-terminal domain-containing protein [Planctomycetota bacterium]